MASALPSLEDPETILARSPDENPAEHALLRGLAESSASAPATVPVAEGQEVAVVEEESDADEGDDVKPLPVSPELAESLLALMQTVREEGGADPEDAEEATELAGRLSHVCQSKEAAILSTDDVCLLQDYFGDYIVRLDEKRRRLDAEGVSQEEQMPIFNNIGLAFTMMGPLVQVRRESNFRTLTTAEAARLRSFNDSDFEGEICIASGREAVHVAQEREA